MEVILRLSPARPGRNLALMANFRLGGRRSRRAEAAAVERATREHLGHFVATHAGVEAFLEPATRTTPMTMVLVGLTGEWTRRRVPDARTARDIARDLAIPVYDVHLTGYPRRMREWNARQRRAT
jgi:hypothetical protein